MLPAIRAATGTLEVVLRPILMIGLSQILPKFVGRLVRYVYLSLILSCLPIMSPSSLYYNAYISENLISHQSHRFGISVISNPYLHAMHSLNFLLERERFTVHIRRDSVYMCVSSSIFNL